MADDEVHILITKEEFDQAVEQVEAQWQAFWTPDVAESFRSWVEGEHDPPDARWRG